MKIATYRAALVLVATSLGCEKGPAAKPDPPQPEATASKGDEAPPAGEPPPWSNRLTKNSGFPCDVEEALAASCRRCHWEPRQHDAPFSLVRWEDTRQTRTGQPVYVLMKKQIAADLMPPVFEVVAQPPVKPLDPKHKKVLLDWLEAGAKKSGESCEGT